MSGDTTIVKVHLFHRTQTASKRYCHISQNTNHTHPSNIQAMIEHNWEKNGSTNSTEHIQSQNTLTRNTLTRNTLTRNTSQTEHFLCPRKIGAFILKTGRQREAICISQEREGILLLLLYNGLSEKVFYCSTIISCLKSSQER